MLDLIAVAQMCAAEIETTTMLRVIAVESSGNPNAIGVVGGGLEWQPRNQAEALVTINMLESHGVNYSVGLGQVNKRNFRRYGITAQQALEPCTNLRVAGAILKECFLRAAKGKPRRTELQRALRDAFSCYYSGNFTTGYHLGYVGKILRAAPIVQRPSK